jgi:hypothetical protein
MKWRCGDPEFRNLYIKYWLIILANMSQYEQILYRRKMEADDRWPMGVQGEKRSGQLITYGNERTSRRSGTPGNERGREKWTINHFWECNGREKT